MTSCSEGLLNYDQLQRESVINVYETNIESPATVITLE